MKIQLAGNVGVKPSGNPRNVEVAVILPDQSIAVYELPREVWVEIRNQGYIELVEEKRNEADVSGQDMGTRTAKVPGTRES